MYSCRHVCGSAPIKEENKLKKLSINSIIYALLLTASVALVWMLPCFPTQDGPSHMYNLVILHDLLNGGKNWGSFFTYKLQVTPNLGFHLIAYPLLYFFTPLAVEKIFVSLYILLMGISVPVFLKTFSGRVFPFAYLVFPVMFNFCLMMGFYSYIITVPLFLLAISASWKIRNTSVPYRILCFNLMGIVLFYFHLIPAVFYLMGLGLMELVESPLLKEKIRNIARLAVILIPSLAAVLFYLLRGSFLGRHANYYPNMPRNDLLRDFFTFSTVSFAPVQQTVGIVLLFFFIFFLSLYFHKIAKDFFQKQISFRDVPLQQKFLLCFVACLVLIYFLMPFSIGEGSYFNQRFPWVIFLVMLPLLHFREKLFGVRICSIVLVTVAVLFIGLNVKILRQESLVVKEFLSGNQVSIPKGSYIMLYRSEYTGWSRIDVLLHSASYYGMEKKCVDIGNYEVSFDIFPVKYKRQIRQIPHWEMVEYEPEKIRWKRFPSIDYLLAWKADGEIRKKLEVFYHVIWENNSMTIWQRNS
jgi:hypothetical protein